MNIEQKMREVGYVVQQSCGICKHYQGSGKLGRCHFHECKLGNTEASQSLPVHPSGLCFDWERRSGSLGVHERFVEEG